MPFYDLPIPWLAPDAGVKYTKDEFERRVAIPLASMDLQPGTPEQAIMGNISFMELDKLFNGDSN